MIRLFAMFFMAIFMVVTSSYAGTSVGNFNFKTQREFDFRMGILPSWTWEQEVAASEFKAEAWRLSNAKKVNDPDHVSFAEVTFLKEFPARNEAELLDEIRKRHPDLNWTPISNPSFTVGFVSEQVYIGPKRTENYEYYFSEKNKVVRIRAVRDSAENGATELDTILSTIRRPSGAPRLVSVQPVGENQSEIEVGERFCYRLEMDLLKNDFESERLTSFEVKGAPEHWSFKDITWKQSEASFYVCTRVNERFGKDGLAIRSLSITSSGGSTLSCFDPGVGHERQLICPDSKTEPLAYQVPQVKNPNPAQSAPEILDLKIGSSPQTLEVEVNSELRLVSGEVILAASIGTEALSQVIYGDQMSGQSFEITFEPSRLPSGFTRVEQLILIDKVGNMSALRADWGESVYKLYRANQEPKLTSIPVISLMGGEQ